LQAAYKKLVHEDMAMSTIAVTDLEKARKLVVKIKKKADQLETEIYHHGKNFKKLTQKKA